MQLLKISFIILALIVVTYLLGQGVNLKESAIIIPFRIVVGFLIMLAVFQLLCVPMTYLYVEFKKLVIVVSIVYMIMLLYGLKCFFSNRRSAAQREKSKHKSKNIYLFLFLILLGVQLYYTTFYQIGWAADDDYVYVVESAAAIKDNGMYLSNEVTGKTINLNPRRTLNSYNIFVAYLATITGTTVTTMAHTILADYLLLIAYMTFYLLANYLCKDKYVYIYLILLSLLNIFGGYSIYSFSYRLLGPIWQGKAVVMAIVLPFLFWMIPNIFSREFEGRQCWLLMIVTMASCACTLMGAGMSLGLICCLGLFYILKYRQMRNLLYVVCSGGIAGAHVVLYLVLR
jgi:hypothetical protein